MQTLGHWGPPGVYNALYLIGVAIRSSRVGAIGHVEATRGGAGGSWAADMHAMRDQAPCLESNQLRYNLRSAIIMNMNTI